MRHDLATLNCALSAKLAQFSNGHYRLASWFCQESRIRYECLRVLNRRYGILGIFASTFGSFAGPVVAGRILDMTDSYRLAFLILVMFSILGVILSTFKTNNHSHCRHRKQVGLPKEGEILTIQEGNKTIAAGTVEDGIKKPPKDAKIRLTADY